MNPSIHNNQSNGSAQASNLLELYSTLHRLQIVCLFLILFAAFIGNSLVLMAAYLFKRLHNANKLFVASLAASDLLVAMFSVTIRLHQYLEPSRRSVHFCRFWVWVDLVSEAASITTVMVITIDRYYKVSKPFGYKVNMTTYRAKCIIACIWCYSAILGAFVLFPFKNSSGVYVTENGSCFNDNKTFYAIAAVFGFFLPVFILIIFCFLIFRIVLKRERMLKSTQTVTRIHQEKSKSKTRSLRTLSLIVITFIICWGPFFIMFLIEQFTPSLFEPKKASYFVVASIFYGILPYANSFLNPVIYGYFDKSFNTAIKHMVQRLGRKDIHRTLTVSGTEEQRRSHR